MPGAKFGMSFAQFTGQASGQAYSESAKIRDAHSRSTDRFLSGADSQRVINNPAQAPVKYDC